MCVLDDKPHIEYLVGKRHTQKENVKLEEKIVLLVTLIHFEDAICRKT